MYTKQPKKLLILNILDILQKYSDAHLQIFFLINPLRIMVKFPQIWIKIKYQLI